MVLELPVRFSLFVRVYIYVLRASSLRQLLQVTGKTHWDQRGGAAPSMWRSIIGENMDVASETSTIPVKI